MSPIKHAAIKIDNIIYVGHRHGDCYETVERCGIDTTQTENERIKQGFVDEEGKFLSRKQAAKRAYQCKQIPHKQESLMSEQLW